MRKTNKLDYIILALTCLIALNIGAIIINIYSSKKPDNVNQGQLKIPNIANISDISFDPIKKAIDSLFPIAKILNKDGDSLATGNTPSEFEEIENINEEHNTEADTIIENLDEYESLIVVKDSSGSHMVENIPAPLMLNKVKVNKEKPYILMYHTHATESYSIAKAGNYRSTDKKNNIVGIGSIISTVLEANGHKVDHVETSHDLPSYNQSYSRSLKTIESKKAESDNLKILLDVHRDGIDVDKVANIESIRQKSKIEIDGKSVATFSLVVGPDSQNKEQVLSFAKYVKAVSDNLYPGLCKGIIIKKYGKYNQYLSDYSALIEVGYNINTLEEANEGAKLIGDILSVVLNSIVEE
ncbi:stage II sporulation protein P [Tissierella sp. MB52-C2]|uniref:stage II sporulation protein P n=1 Tax=Tissierella sp. MB52-C2 TaxID=3070999 RepID=UPI00280BB96A|nr:stage II sporulation protein P [Tissierella sp. MB52-C2]WMM23518.1 stage II sporulation protein P [Tissierella sp. MB52-C2]